jgi:flagellar motor protein MotB
MATPERSGFAHSMTDLMASVAVLFLLVAAIFMVRSMKTARAAREKLEQAKKEQISYRDELKGLMDLLRVNPEVIALATIEPDPKDPFVFSVIIRDNALAFGSGECALSPAASNLIREQFPVILRPVCDMVAKGVVERITLEGHTDAAPFVTHEAKCGVDRPSPTHCGTGSDAPECLRVGFENNVRLSGSRAQSVFFEMRSGLEREPVLLDCLDRYFVVAGRGPVEPADGSDWHKPNSGTEAAGRNRRVVFKIRGRSSVNLLANSGASR